MKYKLINKETGKEHLCDKVTIDGFDYYFINEIPLNGIYYDEYLGKILQVVEIVIKNDTDFEDRIYYNSDGRCSKIKNCKKVIATNNPNIDIPQVINNNISMDLAYKHTEKLILSSEGKTQRWWGFQEGYNKSQ